MTHDELLAKLDELDHSCSVVGITVAALRAVVELHKPNKTGGCSAEYIDCHSSSGLHCDESCNTYVVYPCKTIQAIEKELG